MLERRDTGMEGCKKRGKEERREEGKEVFRTKGIQERIQERRETEKDGSGQKVC